MHNTTQDPSVWTLAPALVASATALLTLGAAGRTLFKRTVGRRRDRYARLARLGTGAHLSFFTSVLGEPPAVLRTIVKHDYVVLVGEDEHLESRVFQESIFIDRDYYVQTVTDTDMRVLAFSVTTRSPRFAPTYEIHPRLSLLDRMKYRRRIGESYRPQVHIKLGRTTFAELDDPDPDKFAGPHLQISIGAHNYAYSEFAYFGNPAGYQSFVWAASDVTGAGRWGRNGLEVQEESGGEWPDPSKEWSDERDWEDMPLTQQFRRETTITTYTVIHMDLWTRNYPLGRFGPHINDVRTLP